MSFVVAAGLTCDTANEGVGTVQHPPTTHLSDLYQQAATRTVYDNPPAIESSRRLLLRGLLRLRGGGLAGSPRCGRQVDEARRANAPWAIHRAVQQRPSA